MKTLPPRDISEVASKEPELSGFDILENVQKRSQKLTFF
jgi:hypothetical protein